MVLETELLELRMRFKEEEILPVEKETMLKENTTELLVKTTLLNVVMKIASTTAAQKFPNSNADSVTQKATTTVIMDHATVLPPTTELELINEQLLILNILLSFFNNYIYVYHFLFFLRYRT